LKGSVIFINRKKRRGELSKLPFWRIELCDDGYHVCSRLQKALRTPSTEENNPVLWVFLRSFKTLSAAEGFVEELQPYEKTYDGWKFVDN
jgi:hypothetical protein